jgi:hypothetical protein
VGSFIWRRAVKWTLRRRRRRRRRPSVCVFRLKLNIILEPHLADEAEPSLDEIDVALLAIENVGQQLAHLWLAKFGRTQRFAGLF